MRRHGLQTLFDRSLNKSDRTHAADASFELEFVLDDEHNTANDDNMMSHTYIHDTIFKGSMNNYSPRSA